MSEREAFGPNLRRQRMQRGVTLEEIARATKVNVDLWSGLERGNLARWPSGIYARSYVRAYAVAIGADPEATVDEFCRWFPQGDRRAEPIVRDQAAIVSHDLHWTDDLVPEATGDRRSTAETPVRRWLVSSHVARTTAAVADISATSVAAVAVQALTRAGWSVSLACCAIAYHALGLIVLGRTPGGWAVSTWVEHRRPADERAGTERSLRLLRGSERI